MACISARGSSTQHVASPSRSSVGPGPAGLERALDEVEVRSPSRWILDGSRPPAALVAALEASLAHQPSHTEQEAKLRAAFGEESVPLMA